MEAFLIKLVPLYGALMQFHCCDIKTISVTTFPRPENSSREQQQHQLTNTGVFVDQKAGVLEPWQSFWL